MAEELLKSEVAKFQACATQLYSVGVEGEVVLSSFVERVEGIVLSEATQWKTDLQSGKPQES